MMQELQPISPYQRTNIVDILRGWALLIVVIMNYSDFFYFNKDWKTYKEDTFTTLWGKYEEILLAGKGWVLLAILFGYGFGFLYNKFKQSNQTVNSFFVGRMLWLLILGLINTAIFGGDILCDYSIMGLILILFFKVSTKALLNFALIILVFVPAIQSFVIAHQTILISKSQTSFLDSLLDSLIARGNFLDLIYINFIWRFNTFFITLNYSIVVHLVQLVFFIFGLLAYRIDFFNRISTTYKKTIKNIFFVSLFCWIVFTILRLVEAHFKLKIFNKYYNLYYFFIISGMLFYASGICWLYIYKKCTIIFNALQNIGKMTLTNYMVQNIISFILFSIIKLDKQWPVYTYLMFSIAVFITQIFFSQWWLSKFNYGPIEWLWRCASYGKLIKLKIK